MTELESTRDEFSIAGVDLEIAALRRGGDGIPIVLLHGFGSTKEDYADIVRRPALDGRPVVAYDAPGCGASEASRLDRVDIPFLVEVARTVVDRAGIDRFHLAGHSMGGLTGLMLADAMPERIETFTTIEGNVAPEDCFLSRQIIEFADRRLVLRRIRRTGRGGPGLGVGVLCDVVQAGAAGGGREHLPSRWSTCPTMPV